MNLYTIGFTKKNARQFFDLLIANRIDLLLDIRLNNKTQLAGFTKGDDLAYFLSVICNCAYEWKLAFAPTKAILDGYRDKEISWSDYEQKYKNLLHVRNSEKGICDDFCTSYSQYGNIVLLCSEPTPDMCHRRLAAEAIISSNPNVCLKHL